MGEWESTAPLSHSHRPRVCATIERVLSSEVTALSTSQVLSKESPVRTSKVIVVFAMLIVIATMGSPAKGQSQTKQPAAKPAAAGLLGVIEKSGYTYTKVADGIYEVPATGKNLKEFPLRLTQAEDLIIVIAKLADRKNITISAPLTLKLMEMNDNYDVVKFALSAEMLYARIDIHARVIDVDELKSLVELMAHVVDEAYPEIKAFLPPAK